MRHLVCDLRAMTVTGAQAVFRRDWRALYQAVFSGWR
jgi:hypothetical protein